MKVSKEIFSKCPKLSIGTFQKQVWVTNYLSYPVQYGGSFRFTKKYYLTKKGLKIIKS